MQAWISDYQALVDYINKNPEIDISKNIISIPSESKPEFYRLFDEARASLVKECVPDNFLASAHALAQGWLNTSLSLSSALELKKIQVTSKLNWFLQEPAVGLMRALHDPLFNLLQGKDNMDDFLNSCRTSLEKESKSLLSEGYRRWVTLALIESLQPDKMLAVNAPNSLNSAFLGDSSMGISLIESTVPDPEKSSELSFVREPENAFLVPLCIIHSRLINSYLSFSPDFHDAMWKSLSLSEKLEWFELKKITPQFKKFLSWPDISIYVSNEACDLKLIADCAYVARPLLNIETAAIPIDKDSLEEMKRHNEALKPVLGSFVLSGLTFEGFPAEYSNELTGLTLLELGHNNKKLEPIIHALVRYTGKN
jgi:hypothetical protein